MPTKQMRNAGGSPAGRPLSRRESKAATRMRLIEAAIEILDTEGEGELTTTAVARRAGISQPSFYVHFSDLDDLLHQVIEHMNGELSAPTREARRQSRNAPFDVGKLRETFRVPLEFLLAHPTITRLLARTRLDLVSPLGAWSRAVWQTNRDDLVADLAAAGLPNKTMKNRRMLGLIAEGVMGLTETLALAHLDGRAGNVEELLDVLVAFSWGYLRCPPTDASNGERVR